VSDQADLEQRVVTLRAERDALLNPTPEQMSARSSLIRQFAEFDKANDKTDSEALEQRMREFFEANGVEAPRYLPQVEAELLDAEIVLARAKGQPVAMRVSVDPESLGLDHDSGYEFRPDLSGSGEVFIQSDFGAPLFLLKGSLWGGEGYPVDLGLVEIKFISASPLPRWGVTLAKFGYPNEEAFGECMVMGFDGIGFYEILNSEWSQEIVIANRERFPETPSDLGLRHFMVACKENTLEVLAESFTISRASDHSQLKAIANYLT
jgi:hypothetical protein